MHQSVISYKMIVFGFLAILTSVQAVFVTTVSPIYELNVIEGKNVTLPCDFSSYLGQEDDAMGSILWEAMGQVIVSMDLGDILGDTRENREEEVLFKTNWNSSIWVELPPVDRIREGDFSITIESSVLSEAATYTCIWQGKTISTVSLKVQEDPEDELEVWIEWARTLPLVRIGIIAGVLLVTALIFFPLLVLKKIPS